MRGSLDMSLVPAFVEVVRHGSFTAAAEALDLPKSTVSRRVSRLEEALGVPLLLRTTRRLRLTEAGEGFFRGVAPAVERVEEAARLVTEQQQVPRGLLRVTVPVAVDELAEVLTRFVARYPEVQLEVVATGRTVDLVAEGIDCAIRAGRLPDSGLIARRLATVAFHLYASDKYLARAGEPSRVEELVDHDCVLFRPSQGSVRWSLVTPEGRRVVEVTGPIGADDILFVRRAVVAGAGVGLLPDDIFGPDRGRVRRILPEASMPWGALHLVYPPTSHLPAKVRAFRDFVVEAYAGRGSTPPPG
jgi:DNA-binding transcriptional LysR family regulator